MVKAISIEPCGRKAYFKLLGLDKKAPEIFKGQHGIRVLYHAIKAMQK